MNSRFTFSIFFAGVMILVGACEGGEGRPSKFEKGTNAGNKPTIVAPGAEMPDAVQSPTVVLDVVEKKDDKPVPIVVTPDCCEKVAHLEAEIATMNELLAKHEKQLNDKDGGLVIVVQKHEDQLNGKDGKPGIATTVVKLDSQLNDKGTGIEDRLAVLEEAKHLADEARARARANAKGKPSVTERLTKVELDLLAKADKAEVAQLRQELGLVGTNGPAKPSGDEKKAFTVVVTPIGGAPQKAIMPR